MILLRFTPILLVLGLTLPGYAAEAIMLPAQEKFPENIQQIEQTEQEEITEEPEQEPEFLETAQGKATVVAAILASLGLGGSLYFYKRKKKRKKYMPYDPEEKLDRQKAKQERKKLPFKKGILYLPRVKQTLRALSIDPANISDDRLMRNVAIGKDYLYIDLAKEYNEQHKKQPSEAISSEEKKLKLLDKITEQINTLRGHFFLKINKNTGDIALMPPFMYDYIGKTANDNDLSREMTADEYNYVTSTAPDLLKNIKELNNEIRSTHSTHFGKIPAQSYDIGFIFPD